LDKINSEVNDMQPEVSEQNMKDYQGEISVAVLDELMAMEMALQLSGSELADRCRQRFGLSVDWRTLRESIYQRKMARLKMNGDTELWDALQRSGRLLDLFVCLVYWPVAEWGIISDVKAWAAQNGCLDDFPSERLERMEVLSDRIKGVFLEIHSRLDPDTVRAIFKKLGVLPGKGDLIDELLKRSDRKLNGNTSM
jgi:hypothetical protein